MPPGEESEASVRLGGLQNANEEEEDRGGRRQQQRDTDEGVLPVDDSRHAPELVLDPVSRGYRAGFQNGHEVLEAVDTGDVTP